MVPGVSHKGGGVQLLRVVHGVPVHALLDHNGHRGRDQRQCGGDGQFSVIPADQLLYARPADSQTGNGQNTPQHQRRHTFKAFVAVGVSGVRAALGQLYADKGNQSGENIGQGMDRVRHHGPGSARYTGKELEGGQKNVSNDPDPG